MALFTRPTNMNYRASPDSTPATPAPSPIITKSAWWRDQVWLFTTSRVPQNCPPDLLHFADAWWVDQLTVDVSSFHDSWGKELKNSSSPEVDLHFLLEDYLQDYGIPPETVPPDFDKLDSLLHELHQGRGGDLLRSHLTNIIRK